MAIDFSLKKRKVKTMTEELEEIITNDKDYTFRLENFEGPLDLLYTLIKQSKMSLEEIKIADITSQYLLHMQQIPSLDLEQASSFIEWAAILLEAKSQKLLPKDEEELPEVDMEAYVKLKIQEYALLKDASIELAKIENNDHFYKEPDKSVNDYRIVLTDFNLEKMLDAFANLLARSQQKEMVAVEKKEIVKDRWTVADKMYVVAETLQNRKSVKFSSFFDNDYSRGEVITVFLALLELLKQQCIRVEQDDNYSDIQIVYVEEKDRQFQPELNNEISYE